MTPIAKHLDPLLDIVQQLIERQTQLLGLMQQKTEALREADGARLADLCQRENAIVQTISELEKRRLAHAGELTLVLEPRAEQPMRLRELAERLPEPARGRLLVLRTQLLERMTEVKRRTSVARRASETLMKHMTGLLNTVATAASGAGTYGRYGPDKQTATTPMRSINVTA